jgi:flagella basal body P-ring formation protein FlgA
MMLPVILAAIAPLVNCRPIDSDWIYGRDLAAASSVFSSLAPDLRVSFSPVPGHARVFRAGELRRLAKANHIDSDISGEICFAWSLEIPARQKMIAAMMRVLEGHNPQIEWIEQSLTPAPKGEMVFPLSGLSSVSDAPVIWRGYIQYAGDRRFSIWARVRVMVKESRVVAAEELHAGQPVRANQLRVESYEGPLTRERPFTSISQVIGMVPRFELRSGSTLTENVLEMPREVERGELVEVIIETPTTHIQAQGVAEQGGRRGDLITVRNARSGRTFRARIEDTGKVLVVPGGSFGLVGEERKS